jgi:ATP-dependent protease ClpP protease subunit
MALFALLPARADVRIVSSPGGAVEAYLAAFARVRQSGERVIIDGPCLSACTLVLSTIPRNRICLTRRAVVGFHAPRWFYPRTGYTARAPPRPPVPYPPPIPQVYVPGSKDGAD